MRPLLILGLTALLSSSCGAATLASARPRTPALKGPPTPALTALRAPPEGPPRPRPLRSEHPLRLTPGPALAPVVAARQP
mgnify:FL=1